MHPKVFVKLKKTLKTLSSGQKNPKKTQKTHKNPKNPKRNQKKTKKPTGLGFFKKTRVFSNPAFCSYFFAIGKLFLLMKIFTQFREKENFKYFTLSHDNLHLGIL